MRAIKFCRGAARAFTALIPTILVALTAAGCTGAPEIPAAEQPLSKSAMKLLGRKGMDAGAPVFVRIFKQESELEIWKARADGRFYHFKTYPICTWSGELGPKLREGDKQAPEGFYRVRAYQMNPNSKFHIAFNLGYPNAYDRSRNRTGKFLMVHGKCTSAGCYAMTDALMEEIYAITREAFRAGQETIEVHAYPFRMTEANMKLHARNKWIGFWKTLKRGYDHFELHRIPPQVAVCERRYIVNVHMPTNLRLDPMRACPRFDRPMIEPFFPHPAEMQIASERIKASGPKKRTLASVIGSQAARAALGGPKSYSKSTTTTPNASVYSFGFAD